MPVFKEMWRCPTCSRVSELYESCYCRHYLDNHENIEGLLV